MVYDTIYACQDRKDDVKVGIRSTAILFGNAVVPVTICFGLFMVALLYASGVSNSHGPPFFVICFGGTAIFLLWKFLSLEVDSGPSCWSFFIQNAYFLGLVIYLGILADYIRIIARMFMKIQYTRTELEAAALKKSQFDFVSFKFLD